MSLETFRGAAVADLLEQARAVLGEDAVVLRVDQRRLSDGRVLLELVAGDPASVAAARASAAQEQARGPALAGTREAAVEAAVLAHRRGAGPDVIAVVGPTGVGKTTTVAKLATHARIFGGRQVGLVCLDTYRVGAVDQLRTYAELAAVPLAVVYDQADLPRAEKALAGCDIVLVDCPGRGPRGQRDTDAVAVLLRAIGPHETHLALPAGLQPELARRLVTQWRPRGATHLLATKLDEYPDDWSLFDLAAELEMPMRWVADGQRVPEDLRSAAPRLDAAFASRRSRAARGRTETVAAARRLRGVA